MDPAIAIVLRVGLALLFLVAARHKLRDLPDFAATLAAYRLLPERGAPAAARAVVGAELGVAVALLTPGGGAVGPLLAAALLSVYTGAVTINLARGRRHIDCGCAGPDRRQALSGWLVTRNAGLLVAALACLVPARTRSFVWVDALTVAGALAALAAAYTAVDRMIAAAPRLALLRENA